MSDSDTPAIVLQDLRGVYRLLGFEHRRRERCAAWFSQHMRRRAARQLPGKSTRGMEMGVTVAARKNGQYEKQIDVFPVNPGRGRAGSSLP